jgi:hypothetical protein
MAQKQIQSEFYNQEIGRTYYEQYFTTQSTEPISPGDYLLLQETLENAISLLNDDNEIELRIVIKSKQDEI